MEQQDLEKLIDEKLNERLDEKNILEAKLQITESRCKFLLQVFAASVMLFGIVLPLFITFTAKRDVREAIKNMKEEFAKLAGTQLRKPVLACFVNGRRLDELLVILENGKFSFSYFELKNIGNAPARDVRVRLLFGG